MNFHVAPFVQRVCVTLVLAMCLPGLGTCTSLDGAAVEIAWRLQPEAACDDADTCATCDAARLAAMRLSWSSVTAQGSFEWPCSDNSGASAFVLPPGEITFALEPICTSGAVAAKNSYVAPAPITRTAVAGDIISLRAWLVLVRNSACTAATCICS